MTHQVPRGVLPVPATLPARLAAIVAAAGVLACASASASITINTVPIGHVGNPAGANGVGSVGYAYRIGTTEVTNSQYAAFLNAVAADDPNELWNFNMEGDDNDPGLGGIHRFGSPGSYSYAPVTSCQNNPVNFVTFWDAARFTNWLHNGQPTGAQSASTTEDGAYTLTSDGVLDNTVTRNPGATWVIPSEDEWFKAAYYQPASLGGDVDNYWLYGTSSNTISTADANYMNSVGGNPCAVGSYAANFYGAFDMAGNVAEWNEQVFFNYRRGMLGGAYGLGTDDFFLRSSTRYHIAATADGSVFGFRVGMVPTPGSLAVLAMSLPAIARRRRGSPATG